MKRLLAIAALVLAGCPIAADNYGNDAGATDAGNEADAGSTTTADAGSPTGSISCSISAEDDLGTGYTGAGIWASSDLADSVATSSDGMTYNLLLEGSNSASGTFSVEIDGLAVGSTSGFTVSALSFTPGSNLAIQDYWTCGVGGNCGANVSISSFDGQTVIGSFSAQFQQGSSSSGASACSLSGGVFNVTFPN